MILRLMAVSGWRCFIETVKLGPFSAGLNVIFAPNGTGKSTLFEALCRGLLDGHRVSGRDVELLKPWGRALSPKVTIEFAHGGTEYRINKQFLDEASSCLERKENGRFRAVAESDKADNQVRDLLTQNPPGRGLSQPKNWGLAQVLWAPQGSLVLEELTDDLGNNIRAMLGSQVAGPGSEPIEARIEDLYARYFTPHGKLRSGRGAPAVVVLSEQLEAARGQLRDARDLQLTFEATSQRVEELRSVRAQSRRDAEALSEALRSARGQAAKYSKLESESRQREERVKRTEAQYNELNQRIELITESESETKKTREVVKDIQKKLPLVEHECRDCEKEVTAARAALEDARKGRRRIDQVEAEAAAAGKCVDLMGKVDRFKSVIQRIEQVKEALAERQKERGQLVAPRSGDLRAMRKLVRELDEVRPRVEASLITLELVPEQDGTVEVVEGEETGERVLVAGKPAYIQGSPKVVAEIPGVARVRAWGPTGSIENERAELHAITKKLSEKTDPFGTDDLDELERLGEQARELDKGVAEAQTQLATLLEERELEDFLRERAEAQAAISKILASYPHWKKSAPDAEALAARAQELKSAFIARVEDCEAAWEAAQAALSATSGRQQAAQSELEQSKKRLAKLELRLAELVADGKKPQERQAELRRLAMAWDAARTQLEEIKKKLEAFGEDPAVAVHKLERQHEAAIQQSTSAVADERVAEGRLAQLSAEGPYSRLALAQEEVAAIEEKLAREKLAVDAVKLLCETLRSTRAGAVAGVSRPVELAATRTFQRIAGRRLGRINIDESFAPVSVTPDTVDDAVALASLSGGESEQLYLATRLALADVLAREERQLVVFDDVLTATDAGRLGRVMAVLEDAAQRLQILILTCHPERYRGLEKTEFFDLEKILGTQPGEANGN